MRALQNQIAVVTGGASGIGRAIVSALGDEGAFVVIVDINADAGARAVAEVSESESGRRCSFSAFDLRDDRAIPGLVQSIVEQHGRIDILVNCAALIDSNRTVLDIDRDTFDTTIAVNLRAPLFLMQAVGRVMIDRSIPGRIVNITSSSAFRAVMSFPAYGSSKAGLTQLTRSAAAEFGPHGINVNCVAPGVTVTPLLDRFGGPEFGQRMAEEGPLANLMKRPSLPEDVASIVTFLCMPASRQMTGQTLHASAGAIV